LELYIGWYTNKITDTYRIAAISCCMAVVIFVHHWGESADSGRAAAAKPLLSQGKSWFRGDWWGVEAAWGRGSLEATPRIELGYTVLQTVA
jgi:hypothetical protein